MSIKEFLKLPYLLQNNLYFKKVNVKVNKLVILKLQKIYFFFIKMLNTQF
jgi:hypothetical protein